MKFSLYLYDAINISMTGTEHKGKKILKAGLKTMAWIVGIWLVILLTVRIVLTQSVLDRLIDRYAAEYVDGSISAGEVKLTFFRHFPNLGLSIKDFSISYPAERFDEIEELGAQGHLALAGHGESADTLMSFRNFELRLNLPALITGKIAVPYAELEKPRIFGHRYYDGQANWDIIRIPADTTEQEEEFSIPEIKLGKICLSEHPHIVYSDSKDTIFALVDLKSLALNGKFDLDKASRNRIGLKLDSLFIAGRVSADTIAFGLDRLGVIERRGKMQLHAQAKSLLATRAFGRMHIPMSLSCAFDFPKDKVPAVSISGLKADIASIPIEADADLRFMEDRLDIKAAMAIRECKAADVIDRFIKDYIPEAKDISTDAAFSFEAQCDGEYIYSDGSLPQFTAQISIPESELRHNSIGNKLSINLKASAGLKEDGRLAAALEQMEIRSKGLAFKASADVPDVFEEDFQINIDSDFSADLKSLMSFIPEDMDISAEGNVLAHINGSLRPSHLDIYNFSHSQLEGKIESDSLILVSAKDSIEIRIKTMDVSMGPQTITSRIDKNKTYHLLALQGNIGKADISYGTLGMTGEKVKLSAMNSVNEDTSVVSHLGGRLVAERLKLTDSEGMALELRGTENGIQMLPQKDRPQVPMLTVNSKNDKILLKDGINRVILTDANAGIRASMNTIERRNRYKTYLDSLARVYPEIARDSLMAHVMSMRMKTEVPEWLKEEDFRKSDIDIKLDEALAKYFREWGLKGNIDVRTGILMTPYFPTRNILRGMELSFDNDRIGIDSLGIRVGESEFAAKGELTGLRRALLGRGILNLDLEMSTGKVNADEMLLAYVNGSRYIPPQDKEKIAEASDAEFFQMMTSDTLTSEAATPLIVIPSNLNADIRLKGSDITYSDLNINNLHSKLIMKERCVQISDTHAESNMGDISFEGFYATRSKQDIKAGFSFNFEDITAEKVIHMVPAVDSLMPLLKTFEGKMNCELAATASIDTNMNIILPSINGIIRIGGQDLTIKESDTFTDLAKKLRFKDRGQGYIEQMSVEGVIADNMLEVFPFIVKLDRYTLAMSGIQNMDESFRYHVSVLRSPLLIRLGVDIYGDNFDKMKFRIGKAKYKNTEIPVFSSVIDTTKINLVNSIRGIFEKGVEAAVSENERKEAIEKHKQEIGYVRAVDQQLEELSESEKKQMEEAEEKEEENITETTL